MSGDDKRELELRVTGWGRRGRSGGRGSEGWWVGAVAEASSLWECRPRAARGWWHAGLCQCVVLFTAVAGERGRERERTPAPALDQQATGCHSVPLRSTHTHTHGQLKHTTALCSDSFAIQLFSALWCRQRCQAALKNKKTWGMQNNDATREDGSKQGVWDYL